ncbi:MAG TPA: RsmD family RNA methyltransferase [Trueperaceae bacterium]
MPKPRIVGGIAGGRSLDIPPRGTRPSPARLREALFDILAFQPRGTFLDLYSGSGAIGLEAASRGWRSTCVDLSRSAASVAERNTRNLGLDVTVVQADALDFARRHPRSYDVVFAAPPYTLELAPIYQAIVEAGVASEGGLYVLQHPVQFELELITNGEPAEVDARRYGSNVLSFVTAQ